MQIKLIDKPSKDISPKVQCCLNRKVPIKDIPKYLSNTYEDIYTPETLGEDLLKSGVKMLVNVINNNGKIWLPVDADCDGFTSAAIFINYLYSLFPAFTVNNVEWSFHEGKTHGLKPFIDEIETKKYDLVVCIDSSSNDIEEMERLHAVGTQILVLDHHDVTIEVPDYVVLINSQLNNYPNPYLSGAGVALKFCQYMDKLLNTSHADMFWDLAATGNCGDMMSMTSLETKELIFKGMQYKNIHNPLINGVIEKNEFAMNKADYIASEDNGLKTTPIAQAFFLVPLINAICRSGEQQEKELIFDAMLTMRAFNEIPSNKRGHKLGEMEKVVTQALRTLTNVKNRQTRLETAGMELLESRAEQMLDNKVLLFTLEPGEVAPALAGLIANKLASKYQRPTSVLTKQEDGTYTGSSRGFTATGIDDYKEIANSSSATVFTGGHANAFGLGISNPEQFQADMNESLKDVSTDIVYYVDYMWDAENINNDAIIDLAQLNDYIGTDFPRPQVYIHDCLIDNFAIMKDVHLKINLPSGATALIWNADEKLLERLRDGEVIKINFVAVCNINEWNFQKLPQLMIKDYEEIETSITESWGF